MTRRSPFGSQPEAIWNYTPLFLLHFRMEGSQSPLCPRMVCRLYHLRARGFAICKLDRASGKDPAVDCLSRMDRQYRITNFRPPMSGRRSASPASITRDPALENLFWFHSEEEALLIKRFIFRRLQPELQLTKQSHRPPSLHYSFPKQRGRVYTLHSRICPPGISLSFLSPLFRSIRASVAIQFEL